MKQRIIAFAAIAMLGASLVLGVESTMGSKDPAPSVLRTGNKVVLQSPSFSFSLDITDGLHAEQWENKITGHKLVMGHGAEVEFDIGLPGRPLTTPKLTVTKAPAEGHNAGGEAVFELTSREPMAVVIVTYRWDSKHQVLHKQVVIRNTGTSVWDRLLDVRLGSYSTDAAPFRDPDWPVPVRKTAWLSVEPEMWADPAGRERGYPAYPENQFFAGLAHPSGFAILQDRHLLMLQHPGLMLEPAKEFICMEAVYGVAPSGEARAAFRDYLYSRMRRVLRGHDRPYAILATCGAQAGTDETYNFTAISEATSLDHISHMAEGQRTAGLHWDYYDIEFWHDPAGDLKAPDAKRFPNGFDPVLAELKKLGTTPGLWISSGSTDSNLFQGAIDRWTIGSNPALQVCGTDGDGRGRLCRATKPANRMYIDGLIHQIRTNKIGMIKLDNNGIGEEGIYPWCNNPKHGHLPGDWSIEANHNAQIELLTALDRESPGLFIILYWGHRSPWWLLHGDTIFDVGMRIEMASLSTTPALYARSSNVRLMDQTRRIVKDLPALGWDSLGVSLSRWCWNNRLGAENWQEGVLMDICRGTLLTHIWSDPGCFPVADRPQMAEFIALLKARPECFVRPRFIGDARKDDVWGYSCSDGSRAMIALDNGSWHDQVVPLELNSAWGLPDKGQWDVYCWYPNHVRFTAGDGKPFGGKASIALRPFSQLLLEVVPAGGKAALTRNWDLRPMSSSFTEASSDVTVTAAVLDKTKPRIWTIRGEIPPSKAGGWFAVTAEFRRDGQPFLSLENRPRTMAGSLAGQPAAFQAVLDNPLYPAPWQTYRMRVEASESARPFELTVTVGLPKNVEITFAGHFVPGAALSAGSEEFDSATFRTPPGVYRSVPFYSLNDRLDPVELDRQLREYKAGGVGGTFLHSRIGLLTPYLGEEWFKIMAAGVKTSQEIGLDAWFYDEDKWPSGFAGGIVPLQNQAFRARCLKRVDKSTPVKEPDSILFEDSSFRYVCHVEPLGNAWFNGTSWVDLMNPAMVRAFIDCTYVPYVKKFGGQKSAPGIFTDEPQVNAASIGGPDSVSFSPVIPAAFKVRTGKDLAPLMPSLFAEVGDWRRVRLDYYRTVADCFEKSFSMQIGDYCAINGLAWTGHFNGEQSLSANMLSAGGMMQQYRHMQMPGIDALGLGFSGAHNAKVMTSVANQYGKARRLSELFGVGGYNMTFEDRIWITAWHTVMGVNFMCPHLAHYSMKGERKRDCPPTISPHQPYWRYNRLFEDYSAKLCYFATAGRTEAEVCVLHPIESVYIEHTSERADKYDSALDGLLNALLRAHRNFDLGDEQIISETGKAENGRFVIGEMAYRVVIVPPMLTIRPGTLALLGRFAGQGGTVLVAGSYPELVDGAENQEAIKAFKEFAQVVPVKELESVLNKKVSPFFTLTGQNAGRVWTHLRAVRGGHTLQLFNTSRLEGRTLALRLADAGVAVSLWNPVDGRHLRLKAGADGTYEIAFAPAQTWIVSTGGSGVGFDGDYSVPGVDRNVMKLDCQWKGRRVDPNAMTLDYARYSKDGGASWSEPEPVLAIHDRFTQRGHYNGDLLLKYEVEVTDIPVSCRLVVEQAEMYSSITVNGQKVPPGGGASYIDKCFSAMDVRGLLKTGSNEILLRLNYVSAIPASQDPLARYGTEIESIYFAGDFAVKAEVADKPLETTDHNYGGLVKKPIHSFKRFSIAKESETVTGDLVPQGYPFYAGEFQLDGTFELSQALTGKNYRVTFPSFEAVVIGVEVNGVSCPPLFTSPWESDVTAALKPGKNAVRIRLTNSLRNLLGPHHHKGGELTEVGPASFRCNNDWPNREPGEADWYDARLGGNAKLWRDDYYMIPFGLLQPPELVQGD